MSRVIKAVVIHDGILDSLIVTQDTTVLEYVLNDTPERIAELVTYWYLKADKDVEDIQVMQFGRYTDYGQR